MGLHATNSYSDINVWPTLNLEIKRDPAIEERAQSILNTMTLEQKVAQMIQPEIRDISVEDMRRYGFGSYLNGGGSFPNANKYATPQEWLNLAESMYQASIDDSLDGSSIPTMWGTDAVHGHNNVIGATLFPHNIGLGAAHNPELVEKIAAATAKEVLATGIEWIFAPTVATVRDDRWGRTYEGYSEDPEIVKLYAEAVVHGLQGRAKHNFMADDKVISTVKHFIGDGGTVKGDDQGDNIDDEAELFNIHGQGYVTGLSAGAQTVMASFNSWHGKKIHGHQYLLTQVLKDKMGFDGFVVGDWSGHGQIQGCSNESCPQAINAGLDMFMSPTQAWKPLYENTLAQARSGDIPISRINDAVTRILRVKLRAGLFDKPSPANRPLSANSKLIGAQAHRDIAAQAVRESLVLLKNQNQLLPLSPKQHVLVAGDGADNIGKQSGGWTITWQGTGNTNEDFPGGSSIYQGIRQHVESAGGKVTLIPNGENPKDTWSEKPDVAIVVFGEDPYAEGHGDRENLEYQRGNKRDLLLLRKLKSQGIPVVSVFLSGRPMWVNPEINASNAFVAAWLPGSEGAAVSDVLFTDATGKIIAPFTGKLSFSWPNSPYQIANKPYAEPPLLPYGFGLSYDSEQNQKDVLNRVLNEHFEAPQTAPTNRVLYQAKMHSPWLMWLIDNKTGQRTAVTTSIQNIAGLEFKNIDKTVQEDALQLTFDGKADVSLAFISKSQFREDLRADLERQSALTFSINLLSPFSGPLLLNMQCDAGEQCGASIDLSPLLNTLPRQQWQTLSIDLRCFEKQGMQFTHTVMPFSLSSQHQGQIGIADVQIVSKEAEKATLSCSV
nr:exo 1,3/1,4-beta-D-glucan glucohydrolase [Alteromonas sp. a30]